MAAWFTGHVPDSAVSRLEARSTIRTLLSENHDMATLFRKLLGVWRSLVSRRGARSVDSRFEDKLLGDRGEQTAVRFLKKQGYRILATQHRNTFGEIDIIALDGDAAVFVEVKTRTSAQDGQPFEADDRRKQEKLTRAALAWLKTNRRLEQPARFDIVSIVWPAAGGDPQLQHFRNAFEATGRGQMFS